MQTVFKELREIKNKIPHQTYKTIIGQIRAGDVHGAEVGISRLKEKMKRGNEIVSANG